MSLIKKKLKNLKKIGFKNDELNEIEKMYNGEFFNPEDKGYKKLIKLSEVLCYKYNYLSENLCANSNIFKRLSVYLKKRRILNVLFPIKKHLSSVGENIKVIIGLVDFLGNGFINRGVTFSKHCLIECGNYTIFGVKIKVGDDKCETKNNLIKLGKIIISNDTWICGGVKISNNVIIGKNCVLGAGSIIEKNLKDNYLCVGRPAQEKQYITSNYISNKNPVFYRSKEEIDELILNAKKLGFCVKSQLQKYFKYKPFNSINVNLGLMYLYSHRLCNEFNNIKTTEKRKKEILDILFVNHGKNLKVGKDLFVDLLGTVIIGDNVTIGDSVYFGGNITIEDNVIIGDNSLLFASGHSIVPKKRHVNFSFRHLLYNYTIAESILVKTNSKIGKNVVIVPGSKVEFGIEDNSLVVNGKVIK